ncbi:MAG: hypothetical protein AAB317_02595 [Nitrospirota bacterium]
MTEESKIGLENDDGKKRRMVFAHQYLEKLINIEVPVPKPISTQTQNLLIQGRGKEKQASFISGMATQSAAGLKTYWPVIVILLLLSGGYMYGKTREPNNPDSKKPAAVQSDSTEVSKGKEAGTTTPVLSGTSDHPPAEFHAGQSGSSPRSIGYWMPILPGVIIFLIGIGFLLLRKKEVVVRDSPEFQEALKIWHPVVILKQQTPRSIKRYKNRVRYFAMRQYKEETHLTLLQKIVNRVIGKKEDISTDTHATFNQDVRISINELVEQPLRKAEEKDTGPLPESLLVALGAIHHCDHQWIEDDAVFKYIENSIISNQLVLLRKNKGEDYFPPDAVAELAESIRLHKEKGYPWPPSVSQRKRFLEMCSGIQTW